VVCVPIQGLYQGPWFKRRKIEKGAFTRNTSAMQRQQKAGNAVWYNKNMPDWGGTFVTQNEKSKIPKMQLPMDVAPRHKLGPPQPLFRKRARPIPSFITPMRKDGAGRVIS